MRRLARSVSHDRRGCLPEVANGGYGAQRGLQGVLGMVE